MLNKAKRIKKKKKKKHKKKMKTDRYKENT